jgi:O-antigen ligase
VAPAAPTRLVGAPRLPARALAVAGALALELAVAYLAAGGVVSPLAALGGVLLLATVGFILLAPDTFLLTLAGTWGVTHALIKDYSIATLGSIDLTISRILGLVVVFGLAAVLVTSRGNAPPLPPALRALVLLSGLFLVLAVPLAPVLSDGAADFVRITSGILIGVVAFREFGRRERFLKLAGVATVSGVIVALLTLLQFALLRIAPGLANTIFGTAFYETSVDVTEIGNTAVRVAGPLGGPQETAGFLLVALAFALARWSVREQARRGATVLACVVIASGILITLTRAATLGLIIMLFVWALQRQSQVLSGAALRMRLVTVLALFALVAVPAVGVQTLASRLSDINPTSSGQSFAQGRAAIWEQEVRTLRESGPARLLVGHGAHSSYVYVVDAYGGPSKQFSPHNVLLWSVVELGLIGLALYVTFLVTSIGAFSRATRRLRFQFGGKVAAVALALSLAYVAQDMFTLSVASPGHRWYFMLFIGAALGAIVMHRHPRQKEEPA